MGSCVIFKVAKKNQLALKSSKMVCIRLDTDSLFRVPYDIFVDFANSKSIYGYYRYQKELNFVSVNWNQYVKKYQTEHNIGTPQ